MKLAIRHRTHYGYASAASQSHSQLCLLPRNTEFQTCLHASIEVVPQPALIDNRLDQYFNHVASFNLNSEHREIEITVSSLIETTDVMQPLPDSQPALQNRRAVLRMHQYDAAMAADCLLESPSIPNGAFIDKMVVELPIGTLPILEYASLLTSHIFNTFTYQSGFSSVVTPLTEIIEARKGVCQDFAHLAICMLRRQGIPARYVSGYLETLPPPGQEKLQGSDASHAWFSVYAAGLGWFDFDPTNNKRPDKQYVTTAWGRDYADVVPIKGVVYGGGVHTLTVGIDVTRANDTTPTLVNKD